MFLLYRVLAYSAGHLIAAAAHQFLRYRGPVQNAKHLPNGKLAVFLPYRLVQMLTVRRCAARTDFLPYRIEGIPAQTDVLLSGSALLPCSEPAQRYYAAASFLYAQTASDLFLHCRQVVPGFGVWQVEKQDCLALHLEQLPFRVLRVVHQAAAQRCCAAVRIRSVPSVPVYCCCDTTFQHRRSADWYCAVDFGLPFFLPCRAKQFRRDSAPPRCCADGIPTGNVRSAPAACSACPRRP